MEVNKSQVETIMIYVICMYENFSKTFGMHHYKTRIYGPAKWLVMMFRIHGDKK